MHTAVETLQEGVGRMLEEIGIIKGERDAAREEWRTVKAEKDRLRGWIRRTLQIRRLRTELEQEILNYEPEI